MVRPEPAALEERIRVLRRALDSDPDDEMAWYGLGRALFDLGRAGEAADAFRRALEARPAYTAAHRELGRALVAAGDAAGARDAFRRGLETAAATRDLQTGHEIEVLLRRLDRGDASPEARAAGTAGAGVTASSAPRTSDARAAYKRAFQHFVNDRLDAAIAGYRRAIELDPTLAIAWNGLAMALAYAGDLDGALEAGRRLVELEPDDPLGHTSLSMFYQRKGMIAEAEQERAIAMRLQFEQQGKT
jgi:tetratricopeptide (TPR) repeat protein